MRRIVKIALACIVVCIAAVAAATAWVLLRPHGETASAASDLPHAQTAIVLGCLVQPDGRMSTMLGDRVAQAAALWKAGKVDRILVSGDHHGWDYDEPDTMRKALVRDGVPDRVVFTDHAGFNTWFTMVRARRVFGVRSAIVVTQGFHMPRALYLARAAGLHANGLTSDLHPYGRSRRIAGLREVAGRVEAVVQTTFHTHVVLGPPVPITGNAQASRGPQPPPAGSPVQR